MIKTVLIAGGSGFLGSHICDHYLNHRARVICVDNLSTGNIKNIAHLRGSKNFIFIQHDVTRPLLGLTLNERIDLVLNLASPASPPHYQRLAIETLRAGSEGTFNLLELASQYNARFLHASTSEIYGDPEIHPQPETYWGKVHCYGPRSMYDESKRYAEALIYSYRNKHKVSTAIARFFNTYGPRMDAQDGRVVSNFIVQALKNKPLTIYGNGNQTRSFCYVDDLVRGIVSLAESKEEGPINLGNPQEFTIKELAEIVIKKTGSDSKIKYYPLPGDDPLQRKPDISMAEEKLGWRPKISLEKGLESTIEYFQNEIKGRSEITLPRPML